MNFSEFYYNNTLYEGDGVVGMVPPVQQSGVVNPNPFKKTPVPENPKRHNNKRKKGEELNKEQEEEKKRTDGWKGAHNNTMPVGDGSAPSIGRHPKVDSFA